MKKLILSILLMACSISSAYAFIFASSENAFLYTRATIELPEGWIQNPITDKMIESGIVLYLTSHIDPRKGMLLKTIKRSDIPDMMSFAMSEKSVLENKFSNPQTSDISQLRINGVPSWRYEVTNKSEGDRALTYSVTLFESDKEVVQVSVWGPLSETEQDRATFLKSVNSLTGLSLSSSSVVSSKSPLNVAQSDLPDSSIKSGQAKINTIKKAESSVGEKKLPLVTEIFGTLPGIPSELRKQALFVEFQGSQAITALIKDELTTKGYQVVEDRTLATVQLLGFGFFSSKWGKWPRFGGEIGYLVEKSGGINRIEVDNFPECVGQSPRASYVSFDLANAQTLARYGASSVGAAAGGVAISTAVELIGEKTGLASATRRGFSNLVGGGNLALDNPLCIFGCDNDQSLTLRLVLVEQDKAVNLFRIDSSLASRKHMPNEMLVETLKNSLSLF